MVRLQHPFGLQGHGPATIDDPDMRGEQLLDAGFQIGIMGATQNQMIDISLDGLSFQYIDSALAAKHRPSSELMILLTKPRFLLDRIPYRTVTDFELANEFSFSSIPIRRRCVEFELMSLDKRSQLEDFILYCSMMNSTVKREMDFAHQAFEVMHHF